MGVATMEAAAVGRSVATLAAFGLSTFVYVTTETLPIGLLSLMAADFQVTPSTIGLLVSGYALVVVSGTVPLTRLTRRASRRWLLSGLLAVFVVATATSGLVVTVEALVVCRVVTALSQALFWAVVTPAAAGLFSDSVRGRALAVVYGGASLAAVLGVPTGTWLGQMFGWRAPFLVLSGLAVLSFVVVVVLMPRTRPGEGTADHGSAPDRGRYRALLMSSALAVTGVFVAFTYVEPFLTEVTGLDASAISPVLFLRGLAGVAGVFLIGFVVDRHPWLAMVIVVAAQLVALTGQFLFGRNFVAAGAAIAITGLTFAALSTVLGTRVLIVAPGSSDMAAAGTSTAFNIGIGAGALIGGLLLQATGIRSTTIVGAGLSLAALAIVLLERRLSTAPPTPPSVPTGQSS